MMAFRQLGKVLSMNILPSQKRSLEPEEAMDMEAKLPRIENE